ncbi:MAG TPA: hypothetical protein VE172_00370, partial [Stackebrandtia sp.]|uniref:AfsR/SARP family transcriptional regulator n=1 Tax=Stackebrandtia sp. TaxID=2023065 RepID=UPI002D22A04E|nr:hypothetical protein [Stackebrandtia sp.]
MVEVLWDDAPPATARRQVQNAMAALRRDLGAVIEASRDGYRLTADDGDVDLRRFESLSRQARSA